MSRPNHIILSTDLIPGRVVTGMCGARFVVEPNRNPFEHEDCARCLELNGQQVVTKLYPTPMRQRPYTSSISTPTDWSI